VSALLCGLEFLPPLELLKRDDGMARKVICEPTLVVGGGGGGGAAAAASGALGARCCWCSWSCYPLPLR